MRNLGALILAAGGSSRFGRPKQLLPFQGESLVRKTVRSASEGGCGWIAVVVGEERALIEMELRETPALLVENPDWERGLGGSIRRGLSHLLGSRPELDAVLVMACDQPFVDASLIKSLIAQRETSGKPIVASSYANTLGVPALFDRTCFNSLLALPPDSGAKAFIASRLADVARVEFEQGALDIDTLADFERIRTQS